MPLETTHDNGFTKVVIDDDCEFEKFYQAAAIVQKKLQLSFAEKIDDFDTLYWKFSFLGSKLILNYHVFMGLTIFPASSPKSSRTDDDNAIKAATLIFEFLKDQDWSNFENSETIGKKGSESGIILEDYENRNGARITLERDCGEIPFAITLGIYGFLFHTHYEKNLDRAKEYMEHSKLKINKFFDLYSIPKDRQDNHWEWKRSKLLQDIVDM